MRRGFLLAALLPLACAEPARTPKDHAPRVPLAPSLVVSTPVAAADVRSGDDLRAALDRGAKAMRAEVEPVVSMKWRDRTLDAHALDDLVAARARQMFPAADPHGLPSTNDIRARHGQSFEELWLAYVGLYAAQLEARYGVVVETAEVTHEAGRAPHALSVVMVGAIPVGGSPLDERPFVWTAGRLEVRNVVHRPSPRPPPLAVPSSTADRTIETIVESRFSGYYGYPTLQNAPVRVETSEVLGAGAFASDGETQLVLVAEGLTASGTSVRRAALARRRVHTVMLRPETKAFGLRHEIHLVRAVIDGSALPGTYATTKSIAAIDGTPEAPIDVEAAYGDVRVRFDAAWHAAMAKLAPEAKRADAELATRAATWQAQTRFPGKGKIETTSHDSDTIHPAFDWDAARGEITFRLSFTHGRQRTDAYVYPNPALETFDCPPGRACAVPPPTASIAHEQRYAEHVEATYVFDRAGRLVRETVAEPTLVIER